MNKSKKQIITIAILIIIVIIIIGGIFIYKSGTENKNNPEEVLKQYMAYINEAKYEEMYDMLHEESRNSITKEEFIKRNQNIYEGMEATNVNIDKIETSELEKDKAKLIYTTNMETIAGQLEFSNEAILVENDENKYQIQWSSKLILPDLENEDKVRISTSTAKRGKITDRNDIAIATQGNASSVGLVPGKMGEDKEGDIERIAELLDISKESITKQLSASYVKEDTFVPIKIIAIDNTTLEQALLNIKGIKITTTEARVYPLGEVTSHLIGYVQNINAEELEANKGKGYNANSVIGKSGLEKTYEERLKGNDGYEIYIMDSESNKKKTILKKEVKDGEDIKLTIDTEIQKKVYEKFKGDKSCSVVINPKTGEILALVSTPTFNSNDFVMGMSENAWNSLKENENNPLYNRYQATWAPGSSFKPVVGAIGLTTNKITEEENYGRSGLSWQKDESWGSYKVTTMKDYGEVANLRNALIYSDNIYFAKAALNIGADTLQEQLVKIGFNEALPFEINLSASQYSSTNKFESEIQLADTGYGQGQVLVNPVHMAAIYSAFVNEGNILKPYIEYRKDTQTPEFLVKNAFSKEAAEAICKDLIQVVESPNGTAHSAKIEGLTIAGKTGTAEIKQTKEDTEGTEIGWFNAFTADETSNKQLLVISMVEDVKNNNGSHYLLGKVKFIFE